MHNGWYDKQLKREEIMNTPRIKALLFDVFGTVVDWRASVIAEGVALGSAKGWCVDWETFADRWRLEGYIQSMVKVNAGEWPWMNVDQLHRQKLDDLLAELKLSLSDAEAEHFNQVWHRLLPFADSRAGLEMLRERYVVCTLSNGNIALLTNMAKRAGLRWDCILSAEIFRKYKPDGSVYRGAAEMLGLKPSETMLVASHTSDLLGARAAGLATAFVGRPQQWGVGGPLEPRPDTPFDVYATDFVNLATKLEAMAEPLF